MPNQSETMHNTTSAAELELNGGYTYESDVYAPMATEIVANSKESKEKGNRSAKVWAIVMGASTLLLTACGPNVSDTTPPTEVSTTTPPPEVKPSPTPTETYTPYTFERTPLPAELEKYKDMSVEEFKALPKEEQWLYASWLDQYRAEFESRFSMISGNPSEKPVVISPNSSGADLFTDFIYSIRMAASFTPTGEYEPSDSVNVYGVLDKDSAIKLVSAVLLPNDPDFTETVNRLGYDGKAVNVDTQALAGFNSIDDVVIQNETRSGNSVTIVYGKPGGIDSKITFTIQKITTYDGKTEYRSVAGTRTNAQ